jgi:hypothetical protein
MSEVHRDKIMSNSRRPQILRMVAKGTQPKVIAELLGCTEANIYKTVSRDKRRIDKRPWQGLPHPWSGRVAPLDEEMSLWLEEEAKRIGVTPDIVARSLLVDAIHEAMSVVTDVRNDTLDSIKGYRGPVTARALG